MSATPNWLERAAADRPAELAVADRDGRLTYSELLREATAAAAGIRAEGVARGEPFTIELPPGVPFTIELHAALIAGGVTRVMTSGTSGEPKPVDLTAANHEASARASAARLGVERDDRWLCCLPLTHIGGLSILVRSAIYGTAAVIEPRFEVDAVADLIERDEVSLASLVPTQLVRLLDAGAPVERPRLLLVGGGPLPRDVLEQALDRGATVVQTYGLTEACSQVCTLGPEEALARAGSAGRPLDGTEVRIEGGEILVRGPTVAPGAVAGDGWLHTGDLGRLDDDGYLWVEGRRDDLIVTGGENVRPERVEAALREHPAVADAAVVGHEDREWGQEVVAFVVADGSATVDPPELLAHARARLERHEVPKRVELIGELPRTASGKVARSRLRDNRPGSLTNGDSGE